MAASGSRPRRCWPSLILLTTRQLWFVARRDVSSLNSQREAYLPGERGALLDWSQQDLADRAGVGYYSETIGRRRNSTPSRDTWRRSECVGIGRHRIHRRERRWPRGPIAKAATEKELTACSCPWGQSACLCGLCRVGVWRTLFASETQRHWRARPIFSAYPMHEPSV
jgi:hypothetical protein